LSISVVAAAHMGHTRQIFKMIIPPFIEIFQSILAMPGH
jgi:hypothetical protein